MVQRNHHHQVPNSGRCWLGALVSFRSNGIRLSTNLVHSQRSWLDKCRWVMYLETLLRLASRRHCLLAGCFFLLDLGKEWAILL
jgi:hypothetical protein